MGKKKEMMALIRAQKEQLERQQNPGLQVYNPSESPIAPQSRGYIGNVFESLKLGREIVVREKRAHIFGLELQVRRSAMEFNYDAQMGPYKFDSERRIHDANAVKAEAESRITVAQADEAEANAELAKLDLRRAKKAHKEN